MRLKPGFVLVIVCLVLGCMREKQADFADQFHVSLSQAPEDTSERAERILSITVQGGHKVSLIGEPSGGCAVNLLSNDDEAPMSAEVTVCAEADVGNNGEPCLHYLAKVADSCTNAVSEGSFPIPPGKSLRDLAVLDVQPGYRPYGVAMLIGTVGETRWTLLVE